MAGKSSHKLVSDNEFRELICTLPVEELFMIEIKDADRWIKFWEYDGKIITCNVCKDRVTFPAYTHHCNYATHKDNLAKYKQLYHPHLTAPKNGGEKLSEEQLKKLQENAKETIKSINNIMERSLTRQYERKIRALCLKDNIKDPRLVFVEAGLPLNQIVQFEFLNKEGEWKPMLKAERMHENSRFFCGLCAKWCGGIITVSAHFCGNTHMNAQLHSKGVRHKLHRFLTKSCRYFFNPQFIINVSERGRKYYKNQADKWLSDFKNKNPDEFSTDDLIISDDEMNNKNLSNIKEEQLSVEKKKAKDNLTQTKLPEKIESKAAGLAENILSRIKKVEKSAEENEGLIGVEYVVKLLISKNNDISYECVLCEFVFNENKMQAHLISREHRLKYCDMHYGDTMKKYKDSIGHMKYNEFLSVMRPLLAKLASAIEKVHSRAVPCTIDEDEFMNKRSDYVAAIYSYRHACQAHGPSFSRAVTPDELEFFKKNRHSYTVPAVITMTNCRFTTTPDEPYLGVLSFNQEDRLVRGIGLALKSSKSERDNRKETRHRSPSPRPSEKKSHKRERDQEETSISQPIPNIWTKYDKEVKIEKNRIEREYVKYRKEPENHPLYELEWNRFWKQRKDELIAEGIDHRTYNYQAEWVHYFKNRLEELFCGAVRQVKDDVRNRLNIPLNASKGTPLVDNYKGRRVSNDAPPPAKVPRYSGEMYDFQQQPQHHQQQPMSVPFQHVSVMPTMVAAPIPVPQPTPVAEKHYEPPSGDDKPNVIHVLRLMTAMEDNLGSLGGKIMDLFSKSLQLEKKCTNNPVLLEKCILTPENCNLLEIAMEKLKGALFAGLLEGNKAQSFNKVIKTTEELLTYAESRGWRESCADISLPENANNTTNELQKLINVIQNRNSTPSLQQKSLSDTLKALMSGKSKDRGDSHLESMNNNNNNSSNNSIQERSMSNSSNFSSSIDNNFGNSSFGFATLRSSNTDEINREHNRQMQRSNDYNFNNHGNGNISHSKPNSLGNNFRGQTQLNNLSEANVVNTQNSQMSAAEMRLINYNRFNSNPNVPFANFDTTLSTSPYKNGNNTNQSHFAGANVAANTMGYGAGNKNIHQNPGHLLRPQYNENSFSHNMGGGSSLNRN